MNAQSSRTAGKGLSIQFKQIPEDRESGMAVVEFIGVVVILVLPVLYIIVSLAGAHAASVAAESAAQSAARAFALGGEGDREAQLSQIVSLPFMDHGQGAEHGNLDFTASCDPDCTLPGAVVHVEVRYRYQPPLLGWLPGTTLKISAHGVSYIGQLEARR